ADQQRADEQRMPGKLSEDARLDAEARIGATVKVLSKERHALGVPEEVLIQRLELLRRDRLVARPPHRLVGEGIANGELVLWAAAGELTGVRAECTIGRDHGFAMLERMLVELGRAEIPVHALQFFEAEFVGAKGTVMHAHLLHEDSSSNPRIFM